jgi:Tfp pilus assembly protein FimT
LKFQIKNFSRGVTLVERVVVIFLVAIFSAILISDFPRIQRQFALSRVSYKLAQDLRRTQDLGLSGIKTLDKNKIQIAVKGYGIYIDFTSSVKKYAIYADIYDGDASHNQKYSGSSSYVYCDAEIPTTDCVIDVIDVSNENSSLYIKRIDNLGVSATNVSINFTPPSPTTTINIDNIVSGNSKVGIVLGLTSDNSSERTIWINTSGLINVQ